MFDITVPVYTKTGAEKTLQAITTPDERNSHYLNLGIEDIQAGFLQAEKTLSQNVPLVIKERLEVAKKIAISGWFFYELYTVSLFWSVTTLEMALKHRFYQETNDRKSKSSFRSLLDYFQTTLL